MAEAREVLSKYCKRLYIQSIDTDFKADEAIRSLLRSESYNVKRFESEAFEQILDELLSEEHFDIVQLEGTYAGPYLNVVRKRHHGIISLRMHNAEFEIWSRLAQNSKNPIKKIYFSLLSRSLKKYETKLLRGVHVVGMCYRPGQRKI